MHATAPLLTAHDALTALLPHASKDDTTPAICGVHMTPQGFAATDRYTIATFPMPLGGDLEERGIILPLAAVEWVTKTPLNKLRSAKTPDRYSLRVTVTGEDTEVAILLDDKVERSQMFDTITGNFPAVRRLIDGWKPSEQTGASLSLTPKLAARILTYADKYAKGESVLFEAGDGYGDKPGPLRFRVGGMVGLLQPNLKIRTDY